MKHVESMVLCGLCVADAIVTLLLLAARQAEEANPLLAAAYMVSPLAFLAVKAALTFPPLLLLDRMARRRSVLAILRLGTPAYILLYVGMGLLLNGGPR